jgi:hypothetical protein
MVNGFITKGQLEMQKAAFDIWQKNWIKFIETPHGNGLGHALADMQRTSTHIKIVHIDCLMNNSIRNLSVEILRHATNVKFSNLSHLSISIDRLLIVVKERLKEDLRNQKLLIVIDHLDVLNRQQLYRLIQLLKFRKPPCGIMLRSTTEHRLKLFKKEPILHDAVHINFPCQTATMIEIMSLEERKIFIRDIHGITNELFVKDLAKLNWGFTKMLTFIQGYKDKGGK